ncbi:MAG: sensor histidine kinase [Streptosporangiales bacterium]|nr:sensor histidine kinase [Streptosporangiales bacterium]
MSRSTRPEVRRVRRRIAVPSRLDAGVGVAGAALAVAGTVVAAMRQDTGHALDAGSTALVALAGLALAWHRRAPVVVLGVVVALVAAYLLSGYPYGPIQLCMVVAMFEVARLRRLRASLLVCGIATAVTVAALMFRAVLQAELPLLLVVFWASWLVLPWSVGALVQVRAAATRRARRDLLATGALEERVRVARDVHDVAGHGFSAVAMQAGVALLLLDERPDQAKESLEAIRSTSTQALTDLRAMLDAFPRPSGNGQDGADPLDAPSLRDIEPLVASVRAAGLPVRLDLPDVRVPREIEGVTYRVVQEALTNVLRHGGPTSAEVRVARDGDTLLVEITDRGVGAADVRAGRGLGGMRDRVASAGGVLVTESRTGGGFLVSARLPTGSAA